MVGNPLIVTRSLMFGCFSLVCSSRSPLSPFGTAPSFFSFSSELISMDGRNVGLVECTFIQWSALFDVFFFLWRKTLPPLVVHSDCSLPRLGPLSLNFFWIHLPPPFFFAFFFGRFGGNFS